MINCIKIEIAKIHLYSIWYYVIYVSCSNIFFIIIYIIINIMLSLKKQNTQNIHLQPSKTPNNSKQQEQRAPLYIIRKPICHSTMGEIAGD